MNALPPQTRSDRAATMVIALTLVPAYGVPSQWRRTRHRSWIGRVPLDLLARYNSTVPGATDLTRLVEAAVHTLHFDATPATVLPAVPGLYTLAAQWSRWRPNARPRRARA